jgi:hypothetical protein
MITTTIDPFPSVPIRSRERLGTDRGGHVPAPLCNRGRNGYSSSYLNRTIKVNDLAGTDGAQT